MNLNKEKKTKKRLEALHIKAELGETMKAAFMNSMCHEIRTPLNSIVGFSNLINEEYIDTETRKSFSDQIRHNTFLLTSLVDNMLEVANLDSSEEKLPCDDVSLNSICRNAISLYLENTKKGVECKIDIPEQDQIIHTHAKYLGLVIKQILDNAIKFTEKGTIVLNYTVDHEKNTFKILITDTGCGIPIEKHEEIFQRFSKLNSFTQGSGLGLYMCRLIATRLDGNVTIDPQYTDGARFIITLPIR